MLVAINSVQGDQGVKTKCSFAILWYHLLAMLDRVRIFVSLYTLYHLGKQPYSTPRGNECNHAGSLYNMTAVNLPLLNNSSRRTFSFRAFLKVFGSIIFTNESGGNMAADTKEGATTRAVASNLGSNIAFDDEQGVRFR